MQVEVEIVLAAHRFYAETECLDGIDSLVDLTRLSVLRWANQNEFKSLASLSAGMPSACSRRTFLADINSKQIFPHGHLQVHTDYFSADTSNYMV